VLFLLLDDEILRLFPEPAAPLLEESVLRTICLLSFELFPRRMIVVLLATLISDLLPKSLFFTGLDA
jgi:hypothetical protein